MDGVRVGISAWTEPTLIASRAFYPRGAGSAEERLRYYATQFQLVEADSPYYFLPTPELTGRWVERTPDTFTFNVKAFSLLTGHPTNPKALPSDLSGEVLPRYRGAARLYAHHLAPEALSEVWRRFSQALLPLRSSGKLGAVLVQYPAWFQPSREHREEVAWVPQRLEGMRVGVEFRNGAWLQEHDLGTTLSLLRESGAALVCVDMPQGVPAAVPPLADVTSDSLAMVRFHGRDARAWTTPSVKVSDRFRYHYQPEELSEWIPRIRRLQEAAETVLIVMNNCYRSDAVDAARDLIAMLAPDGRP